MTELALDNVCENLCIPVWVLSATNALISDSSEWVRVEARCDTYPKPEGPLM